jgi:nucleotide-binding universal stress UspA family protein
LFIAAYYAARYGCSLSIAIPSKEGSSSLKSMDFAQEYLSALGVQFESSFLDQEAIEQELHDLISEKQFSTVIMGGYESGGLLDRIFASNVDKVLEISDVPVLVCQ